MITAITLLLEGSDNWGLDNRRSTVLHRQMQTF